MMGMDGLDYAKCQNQDKRTQVELIQLLMRKKTKKCNSVVFYILETNWQWQEQFYSELEFFSFRERESTFSLDFRSIGPSVLDGARSKAVLHGEGYVWTLIWWSSDNFKR